MSADRQRVEKVPGSRRARLTPAPGTVAEPDPPAVEDAPGPVPPGSGPNDDRLKRDVPPHY